MARGLKFQIKEEEGLYYRCSENKGADQLCGYHEADLRLCFRICKKPVFSRRGSYELHGVKTGLGGFRHKPAFSSTGTASILKFCLQKLFKYAKAACLLTTWSFSKVLWGPTLQRDSDILLQTILCLYTILPILYW